VYVCVCVCVREIERVCVFVCAGACIREHQREGVCVRKREYYVCVVCLSVRKRVSVCACVHVCIIIYHALPRKSLLHAICAPTRENSV